MIFNKKYKNRMQEYSHQKIKGDEYYTSREEVEYIFEKVIPKGFLKDKIIYCPCDSEESEFVKYLKENKDRYEYKEFIYTSDDFNTHIDLFEYADLVITNPPFSKIKRQLLPILENHTKYWFIFHTLPLIYNYPNYHCYRAPQSFKFTTGYVTSKGDHEAFVQHIYVSNFECNDLVKTKNIPDKTYDEIYRDKEPIYGIFDDIRYLCIDRLCDIPVDYELPMFVPLSILLDCNRKGYEIITTNIWNYHKEKDKKLFYYSDNKGRFHRILVKKKFIIIT